MSFRDKQIPQMDACAEWKEGDCGMDRLWAEGVRELNLALEGLDRSSALARERVRRLEDFPQFLDNLACIRLEVRASVPRLSLSSLPDDIISLILHSAETGYDSYEYVVDVSLVCRRFRRIVLSSPSLWAACRLETRMPPRIIDMIASRSGSKGLRVHIWVKGDNWEKVNKLFEYSARWEEASFTLTDSKTTSQLLPIHFPNPDLSGLVELAVRDKRNYHDARICPYSSWSLPSLRILKDEIRIPPSAGSFSQLTDCSILMRAEEFAELNDFLSAVAALEKLKLTIWTLPASPDAIVRSPTVNLPVLRNLELVLSPVYSPSLVEHILLAFLRPGITALDVRLYQYSGECTDEAILGHRRAFSKLGDLCPALKSLRFDLEGPTAREKLYFMDDIVDDLPNTIESIDVFAERTLLFASAAAPTPIPGVLGASHPHLKTLRFRCHVFPGLDFFRDVAAQLHMRGVRLKKLSVGYNDKSKDMEMQIQEIYREVGVLVM